MSMWARSWRLAREKLRFLRTLILVLAMPLCAGICNDPVEPASLSVSVTNLDFDSTTTQLTFKVNNVGDAQLDWDVTSEETWIDCDPLSGINDRIITVSVDRTGLNPGVYSGKINITSNGGDRAMTVRMRVLAYPALLVSPTGLDFGETVTEKTFQIQNAGTGTLEWQIETDPSWISVDALSGSQSQTVTATVHRAWLEGGPHEGTIAVTSNGGDDTVTVFMRVPLGELSVSPPRIDFGQTTVHAQLNVTNIGVGRLSWAISSSYPSWIASIYPTDGSRDAVVDVMVSRDSLVGGYYDSFIDITSTENDVFVPVTIEQPLLFNADFNSDRFDERPDTTLPGPPHGDYLNLREYHGSMIRVRSESMGLRDEPVELIHIPGQPGLDGILAWLEFSGGPGCDSIRVSWESVAASLDDVRLSIRVYGGYLGVQNMGELLYEANGDLMYDSGDGLTTLDTKYTPGVPQEFEILVDLANQTTTLSIDAAVVLQGVDFIETADDVTSIRIETWGAVGKVFAMDNIQAVAGTCGPP